MQKSFTGEEFIKALSEGMIKEALVLEGVTKPAEKDVNAVLFSEGTSCQNWILVPREVIENVDVIGYVQCLDHRHPRVRLHLKEAGDSPMARVFAELLKSRAADLR